MAIWKDQSPPKREGVSPLTDATVRLDDVRADPGHEAPRRASGQAQQESLIAAGITIEGKIEGAGHIRVAGRFKGDVHVQGDLTIEAGAKVTGGVRAATVVIAGELDGNVEGASRVELRDTGVLNGDLKAGSLTVAAGSRMRGQVEFGWDEKATARATPAREAAAIS